MSMWDYNEELHNRTVAKENYDEGFTKGKKIGVEEGIEQGEELLLIKQICKKISKGKDPEAIAEELEVPLEKAKAIYDIA
ncbi:MAG: hypothetical protein K5859_03730, partial [Atopobiaceae bacterium]|nr:hypothetical protein [Atopobiaceae bacterium]